MKDKGKKTRGKSSISVLLSSESFYVDPKEKSQISERKSSPADVNEQNDTQPESPPGANQECLETDENAQENQQNEEVKRVRGLLFPPPENSGAAQQESQQEDSSHLGPNHYKSNRGQQSDEHLLGRGKLGIL